MTNKLLLKASYKQGKPSKSATARTPTSTGADTAYLWLGIGQTQRQPEHLIADGVGVVDLIRCRPAAVRAEMVVLVRAGAGVFLDEKEADDARTVRERAASLRIVVAGDVVGAGRVEAPAFGTLLREVEVKAGEVLGEEPVKERGLRATPKIDMKLFPN